MGNSARCCPRPSNEGTNGRAFHGYSIKLGRLPDRGTRVEWARCGTQSCKLAGGDTDHAAAYVLDSNFHCSWTGQGNLPGLLPGSANGSHIGSLWHLKLKETVMFLTDFNSHDGRCDRRDDPGSARHLGTCCGVLCWSAAEQATSRHPCPPDCHSQKPTRSHSSGQLVHFC